MPFFIGIPIPVGWGTRYLAL